MSEKLKRVQMLLEPVQHQTLANLANLQGKSIAEVTRHVINLGITELRKHDEFSRRAAALRKAEALRQSMLEHYGHPLEIDISADLTYIREE